MTMTSSPPQMGTTHAASLLVNIVQLRNEGDTTFDKKYGPHDRLIIEPDQSVFVTEEVAWHFLGRWWANNSNPRFRERVEEVRRLRVFYGAYEDAVAWETNRPRLTAWTSTGERITTVVDDPDGEQSQHGNTLGSSAQSQEAQINFLQDQLLQLTARFERAQLQAQGEAQPVIRDDSAPPPTMPPGPAVPGPKMGNVPGAGQLPIAPPPIEADIDAAAGARLPVAAETLDIDVDSPQRPPVGPRRVGHPVITE